MNHTKDDVARKNSRTPEKQERMAIERQSLPAAKPAAGLNSKRVIKRSLQLLVSAIGRPVWCFPGHSLVVLMYHRVLAEGHPDMATMQPGMVVSASTFDMHLEVLKQNFTLVHLSDWIRRSRSGRPLPPRACAITFDDGWRDNYEVALPLMRKHQVPGTLFLVSDYVGTHRQFWPERLARVLRTVQGDEGAWRNRAFHWLAELCIGRNDSIDDAIGRAKKLRDRELDLLIRRMEESIGVEEITPTPHLVDWHQARDLAQSGLMEIGSHTRTHCRLGRMESEQEAVDEIVGSKQVLQEQIGKQVELFCYPNGEISPGALRIVRRNYVAACSTRRGWNSAENDVHRLHRISIHEGISSDYHAFVSRLSGWL